MKQAIVVLSGGMDSSTLLYQMLSKGYQVKALSFDYGQKHKKELLYAEKTCAVLSVPYLMVDISTINQLIGNSALTSDAEIPEGHYEDENMKATVVPNRNMILLSLAIGYAVSEDIGIVAYAAHSGDHAIYPDCRPEFIKAMQTVAGIANYLSVAIEVPFMDMSKGDIAKIGKQLKVDYSLTWTCYKGEELPCKKCGACVERIEAMREAGVKDTQYD